MKHRALLFVVLASVFSLALSAPDRVKQHSSRAQFLSQTLEKTKKAKSNERPLPVAMPAKKADPNELPHI